ncbi:V-type ATP synthase subunit I [Chitinivibrio alkaliphilus]|uniref:V-type ATPase, subunit I n=1 Tax=Chitinivibrio alkaliphilus ACht1 TaxID=1313304 RepID=U7DBQ5_9BACT|nr:V-type ATPase 116kDa subunit family protein [Chitinivibrio alkaliphilus]ERP31835.1 V-type ATPase, subunit I [Chitinivibrio alkaliphilus ACht1]
MIEPMKKLELLLYHREQEPFLESLREAGVVHIETQQETLSKKEEAARSELLRIDKVLREISRMKGLSLDEEPNTHGEKLVAQFEELCEKEEALKTEKNSLRKDVLQLTNWGNFSPKELDKLRHHGVYAHFFDLPNKDMKLLEGQTYEVITDAGASKYVVVFSRDEVLTLHGMEAAAIPMKSLREVEDTIARIDSTLEEIAQEKKAVSKQRACIQEFRDEVEGALRFERARNSMTGLTQDKLLHLTGWVPVKVEEKTQAVLEEYSCWYEFTEPTRGDKVPVKMKNKRGAQLFEPITKIFDLPDYFELDPTPFFAPFYALFFGLCLGDLGYGFLMVLAAVLGIKLLPQKMLPLLFLGAILGGATMISGVLLNTVFGAPLFNGWQGELFSGQHMALLQEQEIGGQTVYPAMAFSVFLGVIQICLGILLKGVNRFRDGGIRFTLFPLGSLLLTLSVALSLVKINFLDMATFFQIVSRDSVAATDVMNALSWSAISSVALFGLFLLFFFNNPDKKIGLRLPLGFWELYQFVTGIMGDGLSYIRLFALGLASGLLANAFNEIAFMVSGGDAPAVMGVLTVAILLLGHTINFILAALGAFVHPLRLTFVEFYNNLEFNGGAAPYAPFSRTNDN